MVKGKLLTKQREYQKTRITKSYTLHATKIRPNKSKKSEPRKNLQPSKRGTKRSMNAKNNSSIIIVALQKNINLVRSMLQDLSKSPCNFLI